MTAILLVHAAATLFMVGLIWFVQVVHYPLLARAGAADSRRSRPTTSGSRACRRPADGDRGV